MTQEATQAPAPETSSATTETQSESYTPTTVEERVEAIKAKDKEPAKEVAPTEVDDVAKARADRAARIEALQKREREGRAKDMERKKHQAPPPQPAGPDPELAARLKQLESYEKAFQDPEEFLSLAERARVPAEKLGAYIRRKLEDPGSIAIEAARKVAGEALTPLEQKMQSKIDALESRLGQLLQAAEQRDAAASDAYAGQLLVARTAEHSRLAPYAHRYLQRHGEKAYLQFATDVAQSLPEGSGLEAIHDSIEAALESLQLGEPSAPSQLKPTTSAPARANGTTVTNSLASKRTAVADDETAFGLLPFEERLRLVKQRHG